MGFIRSKKVYAILMNNDEGREIVRMAPRLEQFKLDKMVDEFFRKTPNNTDEINDLTEKQQAPENKQGSTKEEEKKKAEKEAEKEAEKNEGGKDQNPPTSRAVFLVGDFRIIPISTEEGKRLLDENPQLQGYTEKQND